VQLRHTVNPEVLYKGEYYYKSGVNDSMRAALKDVVESAHRYTELKEFDHVIDIGSNDGTLLSFYPPKVYTIGFEPSKVKQTYCPDMYIQKFFNETLYRINAPEGRKRAKIITACAMFYDLEDPLRFLQDIYKVLDDEGVFIIQMNYLRAMVDNCNFDNISHEHLCYYSIRDMERLTERAGLYIEDAELNGVNGGSVRLYIRKDTDKPRAKSNRFTELREKERIWYEDPVYDPEHPAAQPDKGVMDRIFNMEMNANFIAENLRDLVDGKRACAVGASTRGYVILQLARLELPLIDRNTEKVGKTLGNMPILSEKQIDDYEVGIVLPYHFMDEMRARYADNRIILINAIKPE
jgi:hypothetical protein